MEKQHVLITGTRDIRSKDRVLEAINGLDVEIGALLTAFNDGVEDIAVEWAMERNIPVFYYDDDKLMRADADQVIVISAHNDPRELEFQLSRTAQIVNL